MIGSHLPVQLGLEYQLKAEVIHDIVMLHYKYHANVIDISRLTGVPDKDVLVVINNERRNIAEAKDLEKMSKWLNWYAAERVAPIHIDSYKVMIEKGKQLNRTKVEKATGFVYTFNPQFTRRTAEYSWQEYLKRKGK